MREAEYEPCWTTRMRWRRCRMKTTKKKKKRKKNDVTHIIQVDWYSEHLEEGKSCAGSIQSSTSPLFWRQVSFAFTLPNTFLAHRRSVSNETFFFPFFFFFFNVWRWPLLKIYRRMRSNYRRGWIDEAFPTLSRRQGPRL